MSPAVDLVLFVSSTGTGCLDASAISGHQELDLVDARSAPARAGHVPYGDPDCVRALARHRPNIHRGPWSVMSIHG